MEINLDQEILHKLFLRYNGHTPTHSRFRYGKVDMTREQDLNGIGKHWKVPAGITVDPLQYVNSYIWYNKKSNIPYETECYKNNTITYLWDKQQSLVEKALEKTSELIQNLN